jgi:hypothetical protein
MGDDQGVIMEASLAVSIASAFIAFGALVVSTLVSVQQVRQMRQQNLLPVVNEAFKEARTQKWFEDRDWILHHLAGGRRTYGGVSGLPRYAQGKARSVGFFYDHLGVVVHYKIVSEDLIIGSFGEGLNEAWKVLEPYICRERQIRGTDYMGFFEDLVCRFRSRDYKTPGLRKLNSC